MQSIKPTVFILICVIGIYAVTSCAHYVGHPNVLNTAPAELTSTDNRCMVFGRILTTQNRRAVSHGQTRTMRTAVHIYEKSSQEKYKIWVERADGLFFVTILPGTYVLKLVNCPKMLGGMYRNVKPYCKNCKDGQAEKKTIAFEVIAGKTNYVGTLELRFGTRVIHKTRREEIRHRRRVVVIGNRRRTTRYYRNVPYTQKITFLRSWHVIDEFAETLDMFNRLYPDHAQPVSSLITITRY
ncbi:MAG: hypothetical protein SWH54_17600 [Thermodesulfobacteriota bacterium]|nr:hypothetical protein [Thermodesulfobacteriota bacterium]